MNKSVFVKRKPLILAILFFSILIFITGTILFFKSDCQNKVLKEALLSDGIRTKAYVQSKSTEEDKRLTTNSSNLQYSSTHFIVFEYEHLMEPTKDKLSLEAHLPKTQDSESTTETLKSLGKLKAQSLVDEERYNQLELGVSIDVIYLAGEPTSVRLLNENGEVDIPMLLLFSYICLFLTMGSFCSLCFYLKTGRTF